MDMTEDYASQLKQHFDDLPRCYAKATRNGATGIYFTVVCLPHVFIAYNVQLATPSRPFMRVSAN